MKQRVAPPGVFKSIRQHLPEWVEQSPEVPKLIFDAMTQIKHLDQRSKEKEAFSVLLEKQARESRQRNTSFLIGSALLAGAVVVSSPEIQTWLQSWSWQSSVLGFAGLALILRRAR